MLGASRSSAGSTLSFMKNVLNSKLSWDTPIYRIHDRQFGGEFSLRADSVKRRRRSVISAKILPHCIFTCLISSYLTLALGGYGIQSPKPNDAPRRVTLPPRTNVTGSKTIKIRYGPYLLPGSDHINLLGERGMLSNYPHINWEK